MTAPISNIYRCGCHGALECPSLERPDRAGAVIGLTLSAASGFIAGSVVTLLLVKLIA